MSVRIRSRAAAAVLPLLLGAFVVGCSSADTADGPGGEVPYVAPSVNAAAAAKAAAADAEASAAAEDAAATEAPPTGPAKVRDAFATLQATLGETCTVGAGDCAWVLGRVHDQLVGLEASMKAYPGSPGHFKEPVAWVDALRASLDGDTSTADLEKHRSELWGTRDRINTWMQGHPEDYR
ncbi:hypothetical protein ACFVXE_35910 [Streptomyces sp. NPDC058231]|uniref:hypothetical protein n=1 Tax=Streptomyces sp. NPDC058231 TaxID=3346392 RepID=UPI0036EDB746